MTKGRRTTDYGPGVARPSQTQGVVVRLATPFADSGRATQAKWCSPKLTHTDRKPVGGSLPGLGVRAWCFAVRSSFASGIGRSAFRRTYSMHFFTSITTNYLPKARVLATSVKRFHPKAVFHLVCSDSLDDV